MTDAEKVEAEKLEAEPAPETLNGEWKRGSLLGRTGLFQIDSVNVLTRAHFLPLFSRLGPYPVELLERAAYRAPRELFEYWGHEASLLPVDAQPEAFFACWTRKEAYVKARGEGLALPLDRFDVTLVPGEPAALVRTADDAREASRWSLQALAPGRGYVGAVAVEGHAGRLRCWQWTE